MKVFPAKKQQKQKHPIWVQPKTYFLFKAFKSKVESLMQRRVSSDELIKAILRFFEPEAELKALIDLVGWGVADD